MLKLLYFCLWLLLPSAAAYAAPGGARDARTGAVPLENSIRASEEIPIAPQQRRAALRRSLQLQQDDTDAANIEAQSARRLTPQERAELRQQLRQQRRKAP